MVERIVLADMELAKRLAKSLKNSEKELKVKDLENTIENILVDGHYTEYDKGWNNALLFILQELKKWKNVICAEWK